MARRRSDTNPATKMLLTLSTWLGLRPSAPQPLLLRVGAMADARTVQVQASWHIRGQLVPATRVLYVSDGVCLLAWSREARAVDVEVQHPGGLATAHIRRDEYRGEVIDLH